MRTDASASIHLQRRAQDGRVLSDSDFELVHVARGHGVAGAKLRVGGDRNRPTQRRDLNAPQG